MTHTISNIIDLTNAPTPPRWFEFLLEPGRLQQHLDSSDCDPSPTQLITFFFKNSPSKENNLNQSPSQGNGINPSLASQSNGNSTNSPNPTSDEIKVTNADAIDNNLQSIECPDSSDYHIPPGSYEAEYRAKKAYALKTLAIKVASFLKWDIDVICNNLSIPIQYKLMQALNSACNSLKCPPEIKKYASIAYCHWFLRSAITYQLSTLQPQSNNTTIIYLSQLQQQQQAADSLALSSMGELFAPNSKLLKSCSTELHDYIWDLVQNKDTSGKRLKSSNHPFKKAKLSRPLIDCFDFRGEKFNDWSSHELVEPIEFLESASYDLGRFFFFGESYSMAKDCFGVIKESSSKFPKLKEYLQSATDLLLVEQNELLETTSESKHCDIGDSIDEKRAQTERFLFDCMTEFSQQNKKEIDSDDNQMEFDDDQDSDLRKLDHASNHQQQQIATQETNSWYLQGSNQTQQHLLLEMAKGDVFMSQGNFKQAMGCFIGSLMLMTDYFRIFSKNYVDEEPYITRMIQCSISLSCYTQAVALCQMTRNLNYTIAFKQLNERVCNDCCDDIYECIWNVTLLEYIINLHSKRGEVERRTRVIQLIGQLELNENNPEEILKEAEHVRRGKFFRIMSNKYL